MAPRARPLASAAMRHAHGVEAFAPGRCTVVGEHVDYADGVVVCIALDLGVSVRARPAHDAVWRVRGSGGRLAERDQPALCGDVGDLPFAVVLALRELGTETPPLDIEISATLPESAGLSSSAALCGATAVALLRLLDARLPAHDLCDLMLYAEREIAGVPCGPLDQRAVVLSPRDGALLLDCRDGSDSPLPWPPGFVLAACHTGDTHDVGGEGYRTRRRQAEAALAQLGAASYRDLDADSLQAAHLDPVLQRRAHHIVTETQRALDCAAALRRGDMPAVGRLMQASHASLRDDYEVSTAALDACAAAAEATPGCLGARLCGAGFGGTAVALVDEPGAARCLEAMRTALPGGRAGAAGRGEWLLRPAPGLAELARDVVS